jgi:hypothetical protein
MAEETPQPVEKPLADPPAAAVPENPPIAVENAIQSYWKYPRLTKDWLNAIYCEWKNPTSFHVDTAKLSSLQNLLNTTEIPLDCVLSLEMEPGNEEGACLRLILLSRVDTANPENLPKLEFCGAIPIFGLPIEDSTILWSALSFLFQTRGKVTIFCAGFKDFVRDILHASTASDSSSIFLDSLLSCESVAVADILVAGWLLESGASPSIEDMDEFLPEWRAQEKEIVESPTPTKKNSRKQVISKSELEFMQDLLDIYLIASELFGERLLLSPENVLEKPYWEQEGKIPFLLGLMEFFGVGFDASTLKSYDKVLQRRLDELQHKADAACGFDVTISSPKKLQEVLYKKLKLKPETQRSASLSGGGMSTSESVLKSMSSQHPLPSLVIEFRQVQKILSAFIEPLQNFVDAQGRISTNWQQLGISTGRLSSNSPNLQALPRGDTPVKIGDGHQVLNVNVRSAFKAATPGWVLIGADYSQLEMRLLAHFAQDKILTDFFKSGKDIHGAVAAHWLKKDVTEVSKQERDNAKRLVYGIMYGIGPKSLAGTYQIA